MRNKIISILIIFLALVAQPVFAWHNDTRDLFQNNAANVYVLNIRTFSANDTNENQIIDIEEGEKVGTFTGAIKRLDSLAVLGINTLHLLPITPVGRIKALGTAGSLYAMDDFSSINPQLDDKNNDLSVFQEAKMFVDEAHKRRIRVIVDLPSCGSYDMFLRRPELFELGIDGNGVVPADWTDVRLFKVKESDGTLNRDLLLEHKKFIDMLKKLGVDGVRADVATIKPYEFWQELISYARSNDPQFLFLAEASPAWSEKIEKVSTFTPYDRLLKAGFDSYLGDFMNYPKFESAADLFEANKEVKKLSSSIGSSKSIILNFATHDDISPMLVNSNYPSQLMWLAFTLPGNTYFVNGFMTGDFYNYPYANRKAKVSYTDDETYYVHKGKLDIFNFSRRAGGSQSNMFNSFMMASSFKFRFLDLLNTEPNILKTSNNDIFAYEYNSGESKLVVILNHNSQIETSGKVVYKNIRSFEELVPLKMPSGTIMYNKGKFEVRLAPSDIAVFWGASQSSQNK